MESLVRLVDDAAATEVSPERYRGVLVGLAVGNALGIPVEGWPAERVRARFPEGLRHIDSAERLMPWDDDVAQSVVLAEALLEGPLAVEDLAARFLRWARQNGRGMGMLTGRVIEALDRGVPADRAAREVWEGSGRRSAGNGAVMRCAPVALRWRRSGARLVEETRRSAVVTHHDPRCEWSAVAVNVALAVALGGGSVHGAELAAALEEAGAPAEISEAVRQLPTSLEDLDLDGPDMGYTVRAMQVGLWCVSQERGFEDVLVEVIAAGGDTDTNGAVAGAVLGSRSGTKVIPSRWIEAVPAPDRLMELADALLTASEAE